MIDTVLIGIKAGGAALGSSIAVVFMPGGDKPLILLKRFVLGTIIGFISAPIILDWLRWESKFDYWLASATLGGLLGYLFLQVLFSRETKSRMQKMMKSKR